MMKRKVILILVAVLLLLALTALVDGQPIPGRSGSSPQAGASAEKPDTSFATLSSAHPPDHIAPWETINSGGTPASSADYQLNGSLGQSIIGLTADPNQEHGIGFWYGVRYCDCPHYCDLNRDAAINPIDVVIMVKYVYKGDDVRQQIPSCPGDNGDWNCDGHVNPVDVVHYVNYVYKGMIGKPPCDPCKCSPYPANCPPWP